jgi:UrcA family protein
MTVSIVRPLVAAALLAVAAPAFANQPAGVERLVISTSGLDLSTTTGQAALERRVGLAIDRLCESQVFATVESADALAECRAQTRAEVQPQIKAALVRTNSVAMQ